MTENFVPYNLALKLRELGFDEECFAFFEDEGVGMLPTNFSYIGTTNHETKCSAPLWQQAFDWFRAGHNMFVDIIHFTEQPVNDEIWTDIFQFFINGEAFLTYFKTYKEAREACLIKLIELCQQN